MNDNTPKQHATAASTHGPTNPGNDVKCGSVRQSAVPSLPSPGHGLTRCRFRAATTTIESSLGLTCRLGEAVQGVGRNGGGGGSSSGIVRNLELIYK